MAAARLGLRCQVVFAGSEIAGVRRSKHAAAHENADVEALERATTIRRHHIRIENVTAVRNAMILEARPPRTGFAQSGYLQTTQDRHRRKDSYQARDRHRDYVRGT